MSKKFRLFNNEIEMGLRILLILKCSYPNSLDKEMINYYSYFSLHTNDIGELDSLHPDVPNRYGELSVKMDLIQQTIGMLVSKGLVSHVHNKSGIEYIATEKTTPFLDNLTEEYFEMLKGKVEWVTKHFESYSNEEIRLFVNENKYTWGSETLYCTKGLLDE